MFRGKHITEWMAAGILMLACAAPSMAWQQHHQQASPQNHSSNRPSGSGGRPSNRPNFRAPDRGANRPENRPAYRTPNQPYSRPGPHSGQWLRQYRAMPSEQQRRALQNDPQFRRLPAERQQQLQQRLQRFNSLPPEQQQRALNRMETWEHLTPQQKEGARHVYSEMQQLPPDRRPAVQNAIRALRGMPPDARRRAIESGRFSQYSPQERDILNGASQLPLAPAEP
jgi:Protein of unknown function (DUF3106)